MKHDVRKQASEYTKAHKRKKRWYKIVTCLAAVVVFCTAYALIMPAVTLEQKTICGMEEHRHDSSCYAEVESDDEEQILICEKEEHQHTENCYETSSGEEIQNVEDTGDISQNTETDDRQENLTDEEMEQELITENDEKEDIPSNVEQEKQNATVQEGTYSINQDDADQDNLYDTEETKLELAELADGQEGEQTFTWQDESAGLQVTLILNSENFTTDAYELCVEKQDSANYTNALNTFIKQGQEIEETFIYKISLKDKSNGQEWTNLGCSYELIFECPNGLFLTVSEEDTLNFTYCKNTGSEPTALPNSTVSYNEEGNVIKITASDSYYPSSAEFIFVRTAAPNGLKAGNYSLTYNKEKDSFLKDSAYAKYYNSNSPIGTAGSFHIVAFDTARLNSHTNGNVLAKNLYTGSNFGTNNLKNELSYIQNYIQIHSTSAASAEDILALGSNHTIDFVDNGNAFSVNGVKIDRPYNLIQDKNTETNPLIDLNRVEKEIAQISEKLKAFPDANLQYESAASLSQSYCKLTITKASGVGVVNYTATQLRADLGDYVRIDGFKTGSNGTVVINVDCAGSTEINMPQARIVIDGAEQSVNEVTEFSAGKVIWNFVNAEGVTINTHLMTGMLLAPGATVNIKQNLNGTVVADNVNVEAESHRTDFTGSVIEPDEDIEQTEYYITVQKIETGYMASALPGAEFDLYQWDNGDWKQINTDSLVTGEKGTVTLRHLEASVAYKLVETKPPAGYVKKKEPFYFWVKVDQNKTQPDSCPQDFSGNPVWVGNTLYAANEKTESEETSLMIQKKWYGADGSELENVPVQSITVNVYQMVVGDATEKKLYQELSINGESGWKVEVEKLPLTGQDSSGNTVSYYYEVEEIPVDGYTAEYSKDSDCITIINIKNEDAAYELPETGGIGTLPFILSGLALIAGALLYDRYRRRSVL